MTKMYIAGPMSGLPNFNFDAFNYWAAYWRQQGWIVFNPAQKDEEAGLDPEAVKTGDDQLAIKGGWNFRESYQWDLNRILEADGVFFLKGWEKSTGARGEHAVAVAIQARYPEFEIIYE